MLKAGLTGGLGCGKTFVARELERLGAHVIHSDLIGHEVLLPEGEAYRPVLSLFGDNLLDQNARIDRARLAALVFSRPDLLAQLNAIVHPAVHRREDRSIAVIAARDPDAVVVVEAAILVEAGLWRDFDRLIVVTCTRQQQMERALSRNPKASRDDVAARLDRQLPMEEKRKYADFLIDTSGTQQETLRQTRELYETLRELARHPGAGQTVAGQTIKGKACQNKD